MTSGEIASSSRISIGSIDSKHITSIIAGNEGNVTCDNVRVKHSLKHSAFFWVSQFQILCLRNANAFLQGAK